MFNIPFVPRAAALAAATFALSFAADPALAGFAQPSSTTMAPACGTAASGTATGLLSDYQATGFTGCTVGALTFYQFTPALEYVDDTATGNDPAPLIQVVPGADVTAPSLRFNSPLFDRLLATTSADYYFEYFIDPPIDILGFNLLDLPFIGNSYVEASVCVGGTFNDSLNGGEGITSYGGSGAPTFANDGESFSPGDTCNLGESFRGAQTNAFIPPPSPDYYYFNIQDGRTGDIQLFTRPDLFADVMLHVHIAAGGFVPDFGTGARVVPEPESWTLAGLGGFVMLGAWRRRRRSVPAPAAA